MAFLDPNTPLATCTSKGCNNCTAGKRVHCHFRPKELFHFYTIVFPSFLVNRKSTDVRQAYELLSHDVVSQLSRIFGTGFCGRHYQTSH